MDKMGVASVLIGLVLLIMGIWAAFTFMDFVIKFLMGVIGIIGIIIGIFLIIFGILLIKD